MKTNRKNGTSAGFNNTGKKVERMRRVTVYYDRHCHLCQRLRTWYLRLARNPSAVVWRHYTDAPACGLDGKGCGETMAVETGDGRHFHGFYAVRVLIGYTWLGFAKPLLYLPGASWLGERGYAWVARNRYRLMGKGEPN
ncbi:DUF393 domain-containing protein [Brevibacillus humidisoli]|uniref:thiol-disulfide oxidoreductase DCC family protein n=1 Tax=Brevibacillus humidisoli TaxID=2895522 RepID=UPI001E28346C|nr:DUF393 domain-containing protein [Brevibacillus humidisoli]UFJ38907.1 DUF393 domain-containing protein [Brevibacillus humidisoli]